jgi:hypothetical protein
LWRTDADFVRDQSAERDKEDSGSAKKLPIPPGLSVLQEGPFIELVECLAQLFLCIHHDGTSPGNGLPQRTA